ncbi:ubiquitin-related domain-containing protein, partial [Baffinella frigidus]
QDKYVSLTVRQSTGRTTSCTISETCELRELMEWWCRCERGDMDRTRFIFDGIQLVRHDTPQQFGMGDGDVIHVMMSYGG